MKDFLSRNLIFISVSLVTLIVIIGGVFLFSKNSSQSSTIGPKVSDALLNPQGSHVTSGIANGSYLPANPNATVTLVEFGDFECPACGAYSPLIKQLMTDFSGKVNFIFRNFPLPQHTNANISAYGAEAASLQGKYWEMHDKLYSSQNDWSTATNAKDLILGYASSLGLNSAQFKIDIDSAQVKDRVSKDLNDGNTIGINETPTFYINGYKLDNPGSYDDFKKLVNEALSKSPVTQTPAPTAYHIHFDLKVYMNDKMVNFGLAKYQSTETKELDPNIHFHDGNGNLVHIHKQGITLGELFSSLKMSLNSNCFTLDTGQKYCSTNTSSLKMFVNGQANTDFDAYVPQDLDRILISYGPNDDKSLTTQLESVTDLACIYSGKCPERGKPPTETCVGGIGTDCTK